MDAIFFAYAHKDRQIAAPIARALREEYVVADFYQQSALSQNLEVQLKSLLDSSALLILLWSKDALDSKWLEMEWRYFLSTRRANVIVLAIDDTPLAGELSQFQAVYIHGDFQRDRKTIERILGSFQGRYLKVNREKLFISYSRKDGGAVEDVIARLAGCRLRPFVDVEFVQDDDTFSSDIIDALRDSVALCFLSSIHSNRSRHCAREISLADKYAKPLALVLLDGSELDKQNTFFFATVPPWKPEADAQMSDISGASRSAADLCRYLCDQIEHQKSRFQI